MSVPTTPSWQTSLGKDITPDAISASPFQYLLLMTVPLQNWAYRPVSQEGELRPAHAPSVLDLVKEFDPLPLHAWIWQQTSLNDCFDRGPLLVEATHQRSLMQQALSHWAPAGGVIVIGSSADLSELSAHLRGLVQLSLPDQSEATLNIHPHHLAAWLEALDEDHRSVWLGPITSLLWRASWGAMYDWRRLDREVAHSAGNREELLTLRREELTRFDANTREHFLLSNVYDVHALPEHAGRGIDEIRRWVEQLLQVAERLNIHDEADIARYIGLLAHNLWLLHSEEARAILNDLKESPPARLRKLAALVRAQELTHG